MGRPEVAGKCRKPVTQDGRRHRLRQPDPGSSDSGSPGNFTGNFVLWSFSSLASACTVVVAKNRLPRLKLDRPKNWSKRPSSGFLGFLSSFGAQN